MPDAIAISTGFDHRLAALLFDRVVAFSRVSDVPKEIRLESPLDNDDRAAVHDAVRVIEEARGPDSLRKDLRAARRGERDDLPAFHLASTVADLMMLQQARAVFGRAGKLATPVIHDPEALTIFGSTGRSEAIELRIEDVPVVDVSTLTWDHIMAVREDPRFRAKATRLRLFLREEAADKSREHVRDLLESTVEDFEGKCREHGLVTSQAIVSEILDSKSLLGASATALVAGLLGSAPMIGGALAAGAVVELGRVTLRLRERSAHFESLRQGAPVALLLDLSDVVREEGSGTQGNDVE